MNNNILNPLVAEMLQEVETVLTKHNAQYYLVGAVARDIHLSDYKAKRRTNDVDVAIMLDSEDEFDTIKNDLIGKGTFRAHETEAIKLFYKETVELDLLPFGDIENEYSETQLTRPKMLIIDVPGFKDLIPHIETVEIGNLKLNVCPLEGIVILKLLAHDDKPERTKDVTDINHFIDVYFDLNSDDIYNNYYDVINLYDDSGYNPDFEKLVSARIIGRKMKNLLSQNLELLERVKSLLLTSPAIGAWMEMYYGMDEE